MELYTQLHALLPDVFNDYDSFVMRYCNAKSSKWGPGMDVTGASNESELKLILNGRTISHHDKAHSTSQLSDMIHRHRHDSSAEARRH